MCVDPERHDIDIDDFSNNVINVQKEILRSWRLMKGF